MRVKATEPSRGDDRARRRWHATGQVQGVGFRPFVYRLASELQLTGTVRNDATGLTVEAQGPADALATFGQRLVDDAPALARIDHVESTDLPPVEDERAFGIQTTGEQPAGRADVTVDTAVCDACRAEMLDKADRRHAYGLINCTNCGPRYSIIREAPYDRPNTTMASFAMCPACEAEYTDPTDRRFHAQPIACPGCGPQVSLVDPAGERLSGQPIVGAVTLLQAGRIVAIKGLGGFHLACRADSAQAVERLRQLKQRDAKPLAVMCADVAMAGQLVELSDAGRAALQSPAAPIVLGIRRPEARVADAVAPGLDRLGVMLAYTPIHHLLHHVGGPGLGPLVMTSANLSDEPLVIDNDEAVERLGPMCDALLWHDRPIERAVDDSVMIDAGAGPPLPVRRARGHVPRALPLPTAAPMPGLCMGGDLKATVAAVRGADAVLSQHLGDLEHPLAYRYHQRACDDLQRLFGVEPRWIACDRHPAYLSRRRARETADRLGVEMLDVQHHHAHAASLMAELGRTEPMLAIVCDGVGYGDDGTMWGGELLLAHLTGYRRLARLRPLRLPGGDAAAKDIRRCGLALLAAAYGAGWADRPTARRLIGDDDERSMLASMIDRDVHCATSSAAGRVFDGIAALLSVCDRNRFEAESGMRLEAIARQAGADTVDTTDALFTLESNAGANDDAALIEIDLSPLVRHVCDRLEAGPTADPQQVGRLVALFHDQLAAAWAEAAARAVEQTGITTVGLSGGVMNNQVLAGRLAAYLNQRELTTVRHTIVPAGDGGLALGQAAVVVAMLAERGV